MTDERPAAPPLARRVPVLIAVAAARLLAGRSPARIRAVLRLIGRGARPATPAEALRARREVIGSSARCAGSHCLDRSLAVVVLLRMRGAGATWCAGVRTPPFAAHAWVEVDGQRIGEPAEERDYSPILVVPLTG